MVKFQIFSTKIRTSTERGKVWKLSPGKLDLKLPFLKLRLRIGKMFYQQAVCTEKRPMVESLRMLKLINICQNL